MRMFSELSHRKGWSGSMAVSVKQLLLPRPSLRCSWWLLKVKSVSYITTRTLILSTEGKEKDEAGLSLEALLADPEIVGLFSSMVCIRVENGSPTCQQFAAIYPVILIPSIYFIGNPAPLDSTD